MHVIAKQIFTEAAQKYPTNRHALLELYKMLKKSDFKTPSEMRAVFGSLDNFKYKDKWYVLDVGGNDLRLIAFIQFINSRIFVKHIATHTDYDKICDKHRRKSC
jgi:mRNA interferase HigB